MKYPILLPNIFNYPFTYESNLDLNIGDYVNVPFGKSKITGVVWNEFEKDLSKISSPQDLIEARDKYLSRRRGLVTLQLRQLGSVPKDRRPQTGRLLNRLQNRVSKALACRKEELIEEEEAIEVPVARDRTLPSIPVEIGHIHPLRKLTREMGEICVGMGFELLEGPEVETEYYNFEALNIPEEHPARADQDTFYLPGQMLLRTHTSPVQIRTMERRIPAGNA